MFINYQTRAARVALILGAFCNMPPTEKQVCDWISSDTNEDLQVWVLNNLKPEFEWLQAIEVIDAARALEENGRVEGEDFNEDWGDTAMTEEQLIAEFAGHDAEFKVHTCAVCDEPQQYLVRGRKVTLVRCACAGNRTDVRSFGDITQWLNSLPHPLTKTAVDRARESKEAHEKPKVDPDNPNITYVILANQIHSNHSCADEGKIVERLYWKGVCLLSIVCYPDSYAVYSEKPLLRFEFGTKYTSQDEAHAKAVEVLNQFQRHASVLVSSSAWSMRQPNRASMSFMPVTRSGRQGR